MRLITFAVIVIIIASLTTGPAPCSPRLPTPAANLTINARYPAACLINLRTTNAALKQFDAQVVDWINIARARGLRAVGERRLLGWVVKTAD